MNIYWYYRTKFFIKFMLLDKTCVYSCFGKTCHVFGVSSRNDCRIINIIKKFRNVAAHLTTIVLVRLSLKDIQKQFHSYVCIFYDAVAFFFSCEMPNLNYCHSKKCKCDCLFPSTFCFLQMFLFHLFANNAGHSPNLIIFCSQKKKDANKTKNYVPLMFPICIDSFNEG